MSELTTLINNKISELKATVNSLPSGGGLERLDDELTRVESEIKVFKDFLAEINRKGA